MPATVNNVLNFVSKILLLSCITVYIYCKERKNVHEFQLPWQTAIDTLVTAAMLQPDYVQEDWIQDILLSRRACYIRCQDGRRTERFNVCSSCKQVLLAAAGQDSLVRHARIANN